VFGKQLLQVAELAGFLGDVQGLIGDDCDAR
jgi:hypothetical protein